MLGGTEFLGIHLVDRLLAQGWQVTLFNRGITQPELFDSVEKLRGDRDSDVAAIEQGHWDVVFDLSGYHPDQITRSAQHLTTRCDHYVFVSTVSAYEHFREPGTTEESPLAHFDGPVPTEVDGATYGPLKALCEERVAALFPSHTVIRPTVIVGPHDPSDRFTYWVSRLSEPGPHVVPPTLDSHVQYVDARDLAQWLVLLGARRTPGVFNAAAEHVPFHDLVETATRVAGTELCPVQLTDEQMAAEEVRAWLDLPMWLPPEDLNMAGFFTIDASRAAAAGLPSRPLSETVRDTLAWVRSRGAESLRTGLQPDRERELVERYGANG